MNAMWEDFVGYLIGALEAEEHDACTRALQADVELQRMIEQLRCALLPLELCQELIETPADLATRTWVVIQESIVQAPPTDIAGGEK